MKKNSLKWGWDKLKEKLCLQPAIWKYYDNQTPMNWNMRFDHEMEKYYLSHALFVDSILCS